jgi:hypothetical protein
MPFTKKGISPLIVAVLIVGVTMVMASVVLFLSSS